MTSDAVSEANRVDAIERDWHDLLVANSDGIQGIDFTSSYPWTVSLLDARSDIDSYGVLKVENKDALFAVLPIFRKTKRAAPLTCRTLSPVSELYGGRMGLVTDLSSPDYIDALLDQVLDQASDWDEFKVTLVAGSYSEESLLRFVSRRGCSYAKIATLTSPYIELGEDWDEYLMSMPKKLRWTMRKSEKKLREQGELSYRMFTSEHDAEEFLAAVLEIENESWKQEAGSSIAENDAQDAFYRHFTPRAGKNGWLSGHVIYLDQEPIAYIFGMIFGEIFSDLKESYKVRYRSMSPGHVLKSFLFQHLIEQRVRLYDFMGECEDYKMRWTDKTYERNTYVVYNKTLKGNLLRARSSAVSMIKSLLKRQNDAAPS